MLKSCSIDEYNDEDPPCADTFQEDSLEGEFFVYIGLGLDDITSSDGFDEINDPTDITMLIKHRNGETKRMNCQLKKTGDQIQNLFMVSLKMNTKILMTFR